MTRKLTIGLVLVVASVLQSMDALGQKVEMGTAFTYQGRLTDGDSAANGSYDFQLKLCDSDDEMAPCAVASTTVLCDIEDQDTDPGVQIVGGLFTVLVDCGDARFDGNARWLEIGVRQFASGVYQTLSPRQKVPPTPYSLALPGLWTEQNTESPNVIGGYSENIVDSGVVGATISGGGGREASGRGPNRVTTNFGTVGGGALNQAGPDEAQPFPTDYATVAGGDNNTASGYCSLVAGGLSNEASGRKSAVGGGHGNHSTGDASIVGGGLFNDASGHYATISGGNDNEVTANYGTIGGGGLVHLGVSGNRVTDDYGTVSGGGTNIAGDNDADPTDAAYATVGGGQYNLATAQFSTAGGGSANSAWGTASTIAGGWYNAATELGSTVGGGFDNHALALYATIVGGSHNEASGAYSLAGGQRANANHAGAFVWADSTDTDFASERDDQFRVRANGGARFDDGVEWVDLRDDGTDLITTSTGAHLTLGGIWTDSSDEARKTDFASVAGRRVLERVTTLPISTWRHRVEGPDVRHIGPTAQDFYATFALGNDQRHIAPLDTAGVALAAIQGLSQILQEKETRIAELEHQNTDLETRVAALEAIIAGHKQGSEGGAR